MGNYVPDKTNKYTVIVTYTLAVVCLLLGLLLPFYYGKGVEGMLVMQLPKALDTVIGSKGIIKLGNDFATPYPVALFGIGKATFDLMAWVIVLYAFVTVLALLAFIPMGVTFKKGIRVTKIFAYVIEVAAVLVLSLYVIVTLENAQFVLIDKNATKLAINMLVAFGGPLLMLIIQCFANKGGKIGVVKFFLFVISALALLGLYSFYYLIPKFDNVWINFADKLKCVPDLYGNAYGSASGIDHVQVVFETNFLDVLKQGTAADKTIIILGAMVGVITLLNFFIDVIGLTTNAKRKGYIFNCVRYGLVTLAAVCLFITLTVAKYTQGLALCLVFILIAIELAINIEKVVTLSLKSRADSETEEKPAKPEKVKKIKEPKKPKAVPAAFNQANPDFAAPAPVYDYSQPANPAPDYLNNYSEQPYANPYANPFGSDQPSFLNPFGNNAQHEEPVRPAPTYDPREGYPPEYVQPHVHDYDPVQDYRNYQPVQDYQPSKEQPRETLKPSEPAVHNVYSVYPPNNPQTKEPEQIYKVNSVYQGPTDEFLRKLTNEEKIEFSMIFIEKSKGEIGRVPDYAIGGDNRRFFNSVFIYLGRIRSIISDGLLNKMYKEINMFR